ncbi:MAG TPA: hypothetical protein VJJ22_00895 [Candidatus Paceibacterota bacterium]
MNLRGIEFGRVWGASGVQGFFGEGYWYHKWLKPFGLDFHGATFVAKTTTLKARAGNMPLRKDWTPRELLPRCIKVYPGRGIALNSVGISGPGAEALLRDGRWQRRREPFFLSFMSVASSASERNKELEQFIELLAGYLPSFRAPIGLQINFSCPNVGVHSDDLREEIVRALDIAGALEIPLVPKLNSLVDPSVGFEIGRHSRCDAICVSNTLPWSSLDSSTRQVTFGRQESPLAQFGGGGISGRYLLYNTLNWIGTARSLGYDKPINGGGGILSSEDAHVVLDVVGPNGSIFLGSIAFLRPWRVRSIIRRMA